MYHLTEMTLRNAEGLGHMPLLHSLEVEVSFDAHVTHIAFLIAYRNMALP